MKKVFTYLVIAMSFIACTNSKSGGSAAEAEDKDPNRFADLRILNYDASGVEALTTKQKELVYYLSQAALSGREIIYAQNYKHNIQLKRIFETIYKTYSGDKTSTDWKNFEIYLKRFWFSNGIHHHYAEKKFLPDFSQDYFL